MPRIRQRADLPALTALSPIATHDAPANDFLIANPRPDLTTDLPWLAMLEE